MVDVITFVEVDGATLVTHDLNYELGGVMKWFRLGWRLKGRRRMAHDLSNLKRIMEEKQTLSAQEAG